MNADQRFGPKVRIAALAKPRRGSKRWRQERQMDRRFAVMEAAPDFKAQVDETTRRWREIERQAKLLRAEEDRVLSETEAAHRRGQLVVPE